MQFWATTGPAFVVKERYMGTEPEEGLVAFCLPHDLKVRVKGAPLLLLQFCQPVVKHKTALMQLFGHLQKPVFVL